MKEITKAYREQLADAHKINEGLNVLDIQIRNEDLHPYILRVFVVLIPNTRKQHVFLFFYFYGYHLGDHFFLQTSMQ